MQRYKVQLIRTEIGMWEVKGYWEVLGTHKTPTWDLDGAPKLFNTRKEALEHCLQVAGVPD